MTSKSKPTQQINPLYNIAPLETANIFSSPKKSATTKTPDNGQKSQLGIGTLSSIPNPALGKPKLSSLQS